MRPAIAAALALTLCAQVAPLSPPPARAQPGAVAFDATSPWGVTGSPVPVHVRAHSDVDRELTLSLACANATASARLSLPAGAKVSRTFVLPQLDWDSYGCAPTARWESDDGLSGEARGVLGRNEVDVLVVEPLPHHSHWRATPIAPDSLPDRWQAYPISATVVLDHAGAARMTPPQRAALVAWSRAGGRLAVAGAPLAADLRAQGAALHATDPDGAALVAAQLDAPRPDGDLRGRRIPGTDDLPIAGFIVVAALFAILAGPVNLWWVIKRKRRRHLFLLTTPLASLAACALLFGYNLLSEGLGTQRVVDQLTWLDADRAEAITLQAGSYFAGTSVDGFTLPADARVVAVARGSERFDAPGPHRHIRYEAGEQLLEGEWIPARVTTELAIVARTTDRRRLRLERPPGAAPSLVNGLDVTLLWLSWRDETGTAWRLHEPLAPGRRASLAADGDVPSSPPLTGVGAAMWRRGLAPGHFVADLGDAPFTPPLGPGGEDVEPLHAWLAGPLSASPPPSAEEPP